MIPMLLMLSTRIDAKIHGQTNRRSMVVSPASYFRPNTSLGVMVRVRAIEEKERGQRKRNGKSGSKFESRGGSNTRSKTG
jgi:hypothetical protein